MAKDSQGPAVDDRLVAAVGVGLLGSALTTSLLAAGYTVRGYDADEARRRELVDRGGGAAASLREAVEGSPVVLLALPTGEHVRDVCLGPDGIAAATDAGTVVIDATTARPADSISTGEALAAHGIAFLDASVSGSSAMALQRDIVFMVGGAAADVERVRPLLEAMARSVHHVGPLGSGTRTKLVVNLLLGAHRLALAEALVFGEQAGLELSTILDVLKDSAAYSKVMDWWGDRMVEGRHDEPMSRVRQHAKDVRLMVEEGSAVGAPMFVTAMLSQLLVVAEQQGLGSADNSAVVEVLRRLAHVGRMPDGDADVSD
jgi:2-hydroxy-3-oxopropionate reductase